MILQQLEQQPDRALRAWLVVATALVCIPPTWSAWHPTLDRLVHIGWGVLLLMPSLYGLLIYVGLLVLLVRRADARHQAAAAHGERLAALHGTL